MFERMIKGLGIGGLALFGLRGLLPELTIAGLFLLLATVGAISAFLVLRGILLRGRTTPSH